MNNVLNFSLILKRFGNFPQVILNFFRVSFEYPNIHLGYLKDNFVLYGQFQTIKYTLSKIEFAFILV